MGPLVPGSPLVAGLNETDFQQNTKKFVHCYFTCDDKHLQTCATATQQFFSIPHTIIIAYDNLMPQDIVVEDKSVISGGLSIEGRRLVFLLLGSKEV